MQGIIEEIKRDTKDRIHAIEGERDREIAKIIGEAKKQAAEIVKKAVAKAEKEAGTEEKRIVSRANLLAKKAEAELVDSLLEEIINRARLELSQLREQPGYGRKLNETVQRAIKEIPSNSVIVEASPEDAKFIKLAGMKGKSTRLKKARQSMTGAIVKSSDDRIRIDCTFEALISEKKQAFKKELMKEIK